MTDKTILDVKNLHISLKVDEHFIPITQNLTFSLDSGKVLALVGESGCGKSVTSMSMLRLLPKELNIVAGEIKLRRRSGKIVDIAKLSPKGKDIQSIRGGEVSMIFQEPMSSFSPLHTIGNQIIETIILHLDVSKKEARRLAIDLLGKVEIADPENAIDRYPNEFSGGMRQRAMIAKALSCNPLILIADEPTTALDVTIQAQILTLMKNIQKEFGMAIIFISHNIGVVAQIANDVAIMYMGRIVEEGGVNEILRNPQHPYTISLLKAVPSLKNLGARKRLEPIGGSVPNLFERPDGCPFGTRCDKFIPGTCDQNFPPPTRINDNHRVYCHLHQ